MKCPCTGKGKYPCRGLWLIGFGAFAPCRRHQPRLFRTDTVCLAALVTVRGTHTDTALGDGVADSPVRLRAVRVDLIREALGKAFELGDQLCIVGVDAGGLFCLVVEDLSEKNNYPSKSEEYMANQVFYQIFFG